MSSSENYLNVIQKVLSAEDNRKCIDCGYGKTEYALIEFGGLICENCCNIHKSLYPSNKILHLSSPFGLSDIKKLEIGGNSALFEYWNLYDLNYKAISFKYLTLSAVFYSEMLEKLSENLKFDLEFLSIEKAKQPSEHLWNRFGSTIEEFPNKCQTSDSLSDTLRKKWEKILKKLSQLIKRPIVSP